MTDQQAYTLMRFQILAFSVNPATAKLIPAYYVYAWDSGVYPAADEAARWHDPFATEFPIGKNEVLELSKFLETRWRANKVPTFYELEDHFEVRNGTTGWDRYKLIRVCRYFHLKDLFDPPFWAKLLEPGLHPTEASSITNKFDPAQDVYLI